MEEQSNQSLGPVGSDVVTKRILHQVVVQGYEFENCTTPDQIQKWTDTTDNLIQFHRGTEEGALKAQAILLFTIKRVWEDLPREFRNIYNNDFWYYAQHRSGKSQVTLENHFRAVQTFFVDEVRPDRQIRIPDRTPQGQVKTDEHNQPQILRVEFDPTSVPMAKLVAATARAREGKLTGEQWSMLADNFCSWDQLVMGLGGGGGGADETRMGFFLAGPYLFAREGAQEAYIGDLSLPGDDLQLQRNTSMSLRERALKRIALLLDTKIEDNANDALKRNGLKVYDRILQDEIPDT